MHRNELAKHLRMATKSPRIPRTHSVNMTAQARKNIHRMPVAGGKAIPGMGFMEELAGHGPRRVQHIAKRRHTPASVSHSGWMPGMAGLGDLNRIAIPIPHEKVPKLTRTHSVKIPTPHDKHLRAQAARRLRAAPGKMVPGMGDDSALAGWGSWWHQWIAKRRLRGFYGIEGDDDLAGHKARRPNLVRVHKPRVLGIPHRAQNLRVSADFIPGMGEEDPGDTLALGYLSADELAADEIPTTNVQATQAAQAGAGAMGKLMLIAGLAFAAGAFLRMR